MPPCFLNISYFYLKTRKLIVKTVHKINFNGALSIPASKSQAQRAIALSLLNKGETVINGLGFCDDENAALSIIKTAGAKISIVKNNARILSEGFSPKQDINVNVGESGLSSRMFTPILANSNHKVSINGEGSLLQRPMDFFFDVLPQLGVDLSGKDNRIPITLKGPLQSKNITINGADSSQYITGIVYGFLGSNDAADKTIAIKNLKSRPYFELSLNVLQKFGVSLSFSEDKVRFPVNYQLHGNHTIDIEGDWSSASFFIVAAAIQGHLLLKNLAMNTKQADIALLDAIKSFGAIIETKKDGIVCKSNTKQRIIFDATDCPDLFPPLAVLALFAKGTSEIKGLHRLKHKESDRGEGIRSTFKQLGIFVELDYTLDLMRIKGQQKITPATVDSLNDHRMAMALTLIGALSGEEITVTNAGAVSKSFPSFYELLLHLSPGALKIEN